MTDCDDCSDATTCTACDSGATNKYLEIGGAACVGPTGCGAANFGDTDGMCKVCADSMTECTACTATDSCTTCGGNLPYLAYGGASCVADGGCGAGNYGATDMDCKTC